MALINHPESPSLKGEGSGESEGVKYFGVSLLEVPEQH